jgi:hypothetical protein
MESLAGAMQIEIEKLLISYSHNDRNMDADLSSSSRSDKLEGSDNE